jgi:hypothetical protein
MTLPDSSFFELLRSIFGNIKTPFNKQRLLADLAVLLSKDAIQKTIASYIDEGDARIIAAVALLGEPAPGDLESFFAGELSYATLHETLLNLEERFILYRFREEGQSRLALNPVLEAVLTPFAADRALLFPSSPIPAEDSGKTGSAPVGRPAADDRLIGGILSFVSEETRFFKNEGGLRKKVLDAGARIFPGFDLEALVGGLRLLGLLRSEGEGLAPEPQRLSALAALSLRERMEYWAAGISVFLHEEGAAEAAAGHLFRGRIHALALLIHRLMDLIRPDRWYPLETLRRHAGILEREIRGGGIHFDRFAGVLENLGLLVSPAPDYWAAGPALRASCGPGETAPALAMDSPFSCILYPGIDFAGILKLASFLTVRETGVVVRFELTRDSAVRGFDRGLAAAEMIALLEQFSQKPAAANLVWSLKDWEKRRAGVRLCRGIVLTLSEERRYLAEAEPVAGLVRETLAPGVYLLSGSGMEETVEALRKAGVDIISQSSGGTAAPGTALPAAGSADLFPSLGPGRPRREGPVQRREAFPSEPAAGPAPGDGGEALKARFREALGKMSLSKGERDELASRINRRLVLTESQLQGASIRYEKLEARLLDYVGKAAIAKQAIASKSLVEINWTHPQEGVLQVTGIPGGLEKTGGESVLVLRPLSPEKGDPGTPKEPGKPLWDPGDTIRIPLGKISRLRRIKKSIFGE